MKPLTFAVLRLLSDGEFHSGEEMAQQLNISRASVWQAMRNLDEAGVDLFRVPGRGYRLREPLQWFDRDKIHAGLGKRYEVINLFGITTSGAIEQAGYRQFLPCGIEISEMNKGASGALASMLRLT